MRDRSHEPIGIGVRIGRLKRCLHDVHSGPAQQALHTPAPLPVTVTDQDPTIAQQAVDCGERSTDLAHEEIIGMRCGSHDLNTP